MNHDILKLEIIGLARHTELFAEVWVMFVDGICCEGCQLSSEDDMMLDIAHACLSPANEAADTSQYTPKSPRSRAMRVLPIRLRLELAMDVRNM